MTVMGERLPEAWIVELHRNGRVVFPLRRWSFLQVPVFPILGLSLLSTRSLPDMLADGTWRFLAYVLIAAYAGVVIALIWQFVTRRPVLVIDHRGIQQRRRFMPWTEIGSIGPVSGPKMARQLQIYPKNVWAKNLTMTQYHVNDLQAFSTWLQEVLEEQRCAESPTGRQ